MRKTMWVMLGLGCIVMIGNDVGGQQGGFGKKKGGPPDGPSMEVGNPAAQGLIKRWEYLVRSGGASQEELNKLGEQGWELTGIEPSDRARGVIAATYVFKRPATGKPKADDKPDTKPAPKAKDTPKTELRLYQLKNARAAVIVALIDEVLGMNRNTMRITSDERTNQVIANAPAEIHFEIEALVQRLDVPVAEKGRPGEEAPAGGGGAPPPLGKKKTK